MLKDSFYVDDLVGGSTNDDQAIEIYEKSKEIMKDGGFVLRKWTSNSKVFQERVAVDEQQMKLCEEAIKSVKSLGSDIGVIDNFMEVREENNRRVIPDIQEPVTLEEQPTSSSSSGSEHSSVKILGVPWDTESDELECDLSKLTDFIKTLPPTKRTVLRLSAKIFDQLSLLAPFTIVMKCYSKPYVSMGLIGTIL